MSLLVGDMNVTLLVLPDEDMIWCFHFDENAGLDRGFLQERVIGGGCIWAVCCLF